MPMKKKAFLIIIFIFSAIAISCIIPAKNKSCNYYYTSELIKKLNSDNNLQIKALNMSYYKIKMLSSEEKDIVIKYIETVSKSDFKDISENKEKPVYRLYMNFDNETYIIDIFDKDNISIFPYDGDFSQDNIKMNIKYKCYNLYYLCNNIFN